MKAMTKLDEMIALAKHHARLQELYGGETTSCTFRQLAEYLEALKAQVPVAEVTSWQAPQSTNGSGHLIAKMLRAPDMSVLYPWPGTKLYASPPPTAERAERGLLREIEWSGSIDDVAVPRCPVCLNRQSYGHATECQLAALLASPTAEEKK